MWYVLVFLLGVVVGAIVLFFVARNNQKKALKYLNSEYAEKVDIAVDRVEEELKGFKKETKDKIVELFKNLKK